MICPFCKHELPSDSKFCQYCGASLSSTSVHEELPHKVKSTKPKVWLIITVVTLIILLATGGIYFGTYTSAKNAAVSGDFTSAEKMLIVPSITKMHDPYLMDYIAAGRTWERGEYTTAKKQFSILAQAGYLEAFSFEKNSQYYEALGQLNKGSIIGLQTIKSLANVGYSLAVDGLSSAKEQAYSYAVAQYRAGNGQTVEKFFKELDGYKRSSDYSTLISQSNYQAVKKLIGFEDANDILLNHFALEFLTGSWLSRDGQNSFTLTKSDGNSYNSQYYLPFLTMDNSSFRISNGIYYLHDKDASMFDVLLDRVEKKNVFRFTIIDANTIRVYCYKDGSSYTLYRQ